MSTNYVPYWSHFLPSRTDGTQEKNLPVCPETLWWKTKWRKQKERQLQSLLRYTQTEKRKSNCKVFCVTRKRQKPKKVSATYFAKGIIYMWCHPKNKEIWYLPRVLWERKKTDFDQKYKKNQNVTEPNSPSRLTINVSNIIHANVKSFAAACA